MRRIVELGYGGFRKKDALLDMKWFYSQQKTASTRKHKSNSNSSKVSVISIPPTIPFIASSSPTIPMLPISSMIPSAQSSKTSKGIHMASHSSIPCIGRLKSWQMPSSMDMPILTSSSNPLYLIYSLLLNNWSVEETFHHISNWRVEWMKPVSLNCRLHSLPWRKWKSVLVESMEWSPFFVTNTVLYRLKMELMRRTISSSHKMQCHWLQTVRWTLWLADEELTTS